jgi:hypothetical protein
MILGRPCRVEFARGNRESRCPSGFFCLILTYFTGPWVVSRRDRYPVSIDEAKQLLRDYGKITNAYLLPADHQELLKLGPAVLVQFADFDPNLDLHKVSVLRPSQLGLMLTATQKLKSSIYQVLKYEPEKRIKDPAKDDHIKFMQDEYPVTRRSIFVKPVPRDITEDELKKVFEEAGDVAQDGVRINCGPGPSKSLP